eukprot:6205538-Pleurochrysis_carterae.AAC.9
MKALHTRAALNLRQMRAEGVRCEVGQPPIFYITVRSPRLSVVRSCCVEKDCVLCDIAAFTLWHQSP